MTVSVESAGAARLPLRVWLTLRSQLLWAYRGAPGMYRFEGEEAIKSLRAIRFFAGAYTIETAGQTTRAGAGDWALFSTTPRREFFQADCRVLSLDLKVHWPDDEPVFRVAPPVVFRAGRFPRWDAAAATALRRVEEIEPPDLKHLSDAPASLRQCRRLSRAADELLLALLPIMDAFGVPANLPRGDARVADAIAYLEENLSASSLGERDLARRVGLSFSQLSRRFVAETGLTPGAFRQQRRMRHARQLLIASTQPIKQIAFQVGFKQPSHFTNWFRKANGLPPRVYRRVAPRRDDGI